MKTFITLQMISISNKCCSFELSQRINYIIKDSWKKGNMVYTKALSSTSFNKKCFLSTRSGSLVSWKCLSIARLLIFSLYLACYSYAEIDFGVHIIRTCIWYAICWHAYDTHLPYTPNPTHCVSHAHQSQFPCINSTLNWNKLVLLIRTFMRSGWIRILDWFLKDHVKLKKWLLKLQLCLEWNTF